MTIAEIVLLAYWLGFHTVPAYYCFRKGKIGMGIAGVFIPLVGLIGCWRLAKPDSAYALRSYGSVRMQEAKARYPDRAANVPADWAPNADPLDEPGAANEQDSDWGDVSTDELASMDKITRKALRKSGRT
jgi:hypothetical protein